MKHAANQPLPADALAPVAAGVAFSTTAELEPLPPWAMQTRATEAIGLALGMRHPEYNLFLVGAPGSARRAAALAHVGTAAKARPTPCDWVYLNNFDAPRKPVALKLPPGAGPRLKAAMDQLVEELTSVLPALFEAEEHQTQRRAIEQRYADEHEAAMEDLLERGEARGVTLMRTPMGLMVVAVKDGQPIKREIYERLAAAEREEIDRKVKETQGELEDIMQENPRRQRALRREIDALMRATAGQGVDGLIDELAAEFAGTPELTDYFEAVRRDLVDNAALFLAQEGQPAPGRADARQELRRYGVLVLVSHDPDEGGAPVVEEESPTLGNLMGRVEHQPVMGALVTDFTLIRPGALHRANGGFLVLDARRLLSEPFAWDALKRSLAAREIDIDSAAERLSLMSTTSLDPDPVPLDVRVALVGDRRTYHLLSGLDPDFTALFKVVADFDDIVPATDETLTAYARIVAGLTDRESLRPLDRDAFAALTRESARMADDAERLSMRIDDIADLLREADHAAGAAGRELVGAGDLAAAIAARDRRSGRAPDLMREQVERGVVLIDTEGARVGAVNALTVSQLGQRRFGRPARVTARVRMGAGKVVDIEREAELGGPIHSKGMMILQSCLAARYATGAPLSLWASIVFEQSYGGVDGDSASAAELIALMSALAEAPIAQNLAITGSVNQFGEIQAIGGVNEKIEGFFDVCAARGLTGDQGVLIPLANVAHLSLRDRVVDAVRDGRFAVIPVATLQEAATRLTGVECGERGPDGAFPEGTLDARVEARLVAFAETRRGFGARGEGAGS